MAVVCLGSVACSAQNGGSKFGSQDTTSGGPGPTGTVTGAGASTSATGGATGAGGSTGTGIITVDASMGSGGTGAGGGPASADAACAVGSAAATFSPVNMFVTFDKSGSMAMNNKWTDASTAFIAFFRDPGTAGPRGPPPLFPPNPPPPGCCNQGGSFSAC